MKTPLFKLALGASSHVVSLFCKGFERGFSEYIRDDLCLSEFNFAGLPQSSLLCHHDCVRGKKRITCWQNRRDYTTPKKMCIYFDTSPANHPLLEDPSSSRVLRRAAALFSPDSASQPTSSPRLLVCTPPITNSGSHRGGTYLHVESLYYRKSWAHLLGHIHYPAWLESLKS